MEPKSRYEVIWRRLKDTREDPRDLRIACPRDSHLKLKRGIIKRKNIDLGYKILTAEMKQSTYLEFESVGNILVVRLLVGVSGYECGLNI